MKHRLIILGILIIALLAAILLKSDKPSARSAVPAVSERLAKRAPPGAFSLSSRDRVWNAGWSGDFGEVTPVQATAVPEEGEGAASMPAAEPTAGSTPVTEPATEVALSPEETKQLESTVEEESVYGNLPYDWISPAQESQPGFPDPNRGDFRIPPEDGVLARPAPMGPDWRNIFPDEPKHKE